MGKKFWGVDIQSEIAEAMPPADMLPLILTKRAVGIRSPSAQSAGTNPGPPRDYVCHGMIADYTVQQRIEDPLIQRGDKKIVIIAKPLADEGVRPDTNDVVTDDDGQIYTVIRAMSNSAEAVWICQCRG